MADSTTVRADRLGATAARVRGAHVRDIGGELKYDFNSADNHIDLLWYPKDIIQSRISPKYRDKAPKVVESSKGTAWEWEGDIRAFAADGNDWEKHVKRFDPVDVPQGRLPSSDPEILLQHMDIGSLWGAVYYGNTRKWTFDDKDMEKEVYRVFNDWTMEMTSYDPERLIVLPWLHAAFPETCADEIYRMAKAGARAVEFSFADVGVPLWSEEWEPMWAAAAETGVVVCSHIGDKAGTPYPPNEYGQSLAHFSQVPFNPVGKSIAEVVFSGVFDRYPSLHVSVAECRIGWLPFLFQWMDRCFHDRAPDSIRQIKEAPTYYVRKNMSFTFEEDIMGAKMMRDPEFIIGDVAVWGCDYPHEQGQTWPDATDAMDRMFAGADPQLKHDVVWGRTQKIFGFKNPPTGAPPVNGPKG